jgi:4-hydroxy-tetrahydrodipicolinate synthase
MMPVETFKKRCKGVVPVQLCPFTDDGELNIDGLKQNTEFLVDFAKGGKDLVVMTNGSTTEFYANSIEEQNTVIKTVVDVVDGKVPVVAGVSQAGTGETIKMAKSAQEAGADCAMVVLPYYHKPSSEGLFQHYKKIAESVDISVMIYNNPDVSGLLVGPELMHRLSKIDNIAAVKDNTPLVEHYFMNSAQIDSDDMVLLNGRGELEFVGSAAYGYKYRGFVTFIANFAPSLSYDVYDAVMKKDFEKAQVALERMLPLYRALGEFNRKRQDVSILPPAYKTNYMYMGVGKACLDLVGLNGGKLKLPMQDLSSEERDKLKSALEEMDLI